MTLDAWHSTQEAALAQIEARWGERVNLLPWESGVDAEYGAPGPDTSRPAQLNELVLFKKKDPAVAMLPGSDAAYASADAYIEAKASAIEAAGLTKGDRVQMLHAKRDGAVYEVTYVVPEYHVRQRVYLTEVDQ